MPSGYGYSERPEEGACSSGTGVTVVVSHLRCVPGTEFRSSAKVVYAFNQ